MMDEAQVAQDITVTGNIAGRTSAPVLSKSNKISYFTAYSCFFNENINVKIAIIRTYVYYGIA